MEICAFTTEDLLFSHKEQRDHIICRKMKLEGHCVMQNMLDMGNKAYHDSYVQNLRQTNKHVNLKLKKQLIGKKIEGTGEGISQEGVVQRGWHDVCVTEVRTRNPLISETEFFYSKNIHSLQINKIKDAYHRWSLGKLKGHSSAHPSEEPQTKKTGSTKCWKVPEEAGALAPF